MGWFKRLFRKVETAVVKLPDEIDGLPIKALSPGDIIDVWTLSRPYVFTVIKPEESLVWASSDGPHIGERELMTVGGACFSDCGIGIRPGWILEDARLLLSRVMPESPEEFASVVEAGRDRDVLLSRVQRVCLNGVQVLPAPKPERKD